MDFSIFFGIISIFAIILAIISAIGITLFVLKGIGLFNISKRLGFNKPWLSFIPVVSAFSLGRVSDSYVKNDGSRAKPLKIWLLILSVLNFLLLALFCVVFAVFVSKFYFEASDIIKANEELTAAIFKILIPIVVFYFISAVVSVAYMVVYYISLWRIFKIFEPNNALLFFVLSIIFGFLGSVFIFVLRHKKPEFTPEKRMESVING